jgi:hypothetical protein
VPEARSSDGKAAFDETEQLRGCVKQLEDLLRASDIVLPLNRQSGRREPCADSRRSPPTEPMGRALIPIAAARPTERMQQSTVRSSAPFLTHLIATGQGAPQTRKCRRTDPHEAIAAYAAMMQTATTPLHAVSQSR